MRCASLEIGPRRARWWAASAPSRRTRRRCSRWRPSISPKTSPTGGRWSSASAPPAPPSRTSGALADARAELDRLAALPKPHPLVQTLRVFVDRLDKEAGKVVDASQLPDARRPGPAATAGPVGPGTGKPPRGDDGRVPDDYVWPGASDTPAVKTPPPATGAATAAPTATPAPPPVETSDIPKEP